MARSRHALGACHACIRGGLCLPDNAKTSKSVNHQQKTFIVRIRPFLATAILTAKPLAQTLKEYQAAREWAAALAPQACAVGSRTLARPAGS